MKKSELKVGLFLSVILTLFSFQTFAKELPFKVANLKNSSLVNLKSLSLDDKAYFTIASVKVNEVDPSQYTAPGYQSNNKALDLGKVIMTIDKLVALGKKLYAIVEAGKPVVDVNMNNKVSVLPNVERPNSAMYSMSDWQSPKTKVYKVEFTNLLGVDVISFKYAVTFEYGGKHQGKGAYIHAARIAADSVDVAWGFNFKATTEAISIVNRGSTDNPVAALTFKLNYTAKSVLKEIQSEESFYVTGNGDVQKVY